MKRLLTCRVFAALILILLSGTAFGSEFACGALPEPLLATQLQATPGDPSRLEPPAQQWASSMASNATGYLVTVVLPVLVFIAGIGYVRRREDA